MMRIFLPLIWLAFVAVGMGPSSANESVRVLTLDHHMKRGEIIQSEDLDWLSLDKRQHRLANSYAVSRDSIIGMELKRSLAAGRPIRHSDIKHPATIRKGDPVTLVYASPGLRLSVEGRALADATTGRAIRVMNLYSKRSIDAVVVRTGLAEVPSR